MLQSNVLAIIQYDVRMFLIDYPVLRYGQDLDDTGQSRSHGDQNE